MASESLDFLSSISEIAAAGFRLSLLLNAAACELAQSGIEIHSITKGISLFSSTLKQTGQAFQATDLEYSFDLQSRTWQITLQGHLFCKEIHKMLDELRSTNEHERLRSVSLQQKIRCCFRKQHVTYLLCRLEVLNLSLVIICQVLRLAQQKAKTNSSGPVSNDAIARDKLEIQNMIIVRYWSVKRIGRLWDLAEQEDLGYQVDPTNQLINSYPLSSSTPSPNDNASSRLGVVSLGDGATESSVMEQSPRDMVQWSGRAVDHLLSTWFPTVSQPTAWNDQKKGIIIPSQAQDVKHVTFQSQRSEYHAYVESDSEESEHPRHPQASSSQGNEIFRYSDSDSGADNHRLPHGPTRNIGGSNSTSLSRESASTNQSRQAGRRQHTINPVVDSPSSPQGTTARQLPLRTGSSFSSQQSGHQTKQAFSSQRPNPTRKRHTISDGNPPRDRQQQPGPQPYQSGPNQSPASHPQPMYEGTHQTPVARTRRLWHAISQKDRPILVPLQVLWKC